MTKQCCICGCEFEARMSKQITCGSVECKKEQHHAYMREYNRAHREQHREYNRAWMRRWREIRGDDLPRDFSADSYAERQKQKTLAMVGSVKV